MALFYAAKQELWFLAQKGEAAPAESGWYRGTAIVEMQLKMVNHGKAAKRLSWTF